MPNLLLAKITILLSFFFLFRVIFNNFFTIPIVIENAKLKLALAIPTDGPITVGILQQIFHHLLETK